MDGNNDEDLRTVWCGNLSEKVSEEILYELFLQAGPLEKVRIPKDKEGRQQSYGFVTFKHQCSVAYAIGLFEEISLFDRELKLKPRKYSPSAVPYVNMNIIGCNTLLQVGNQLNQVAFDNRVGLLTPPLLEYSREHHHHTPRGRQNYYRNESLQGRWSNNHAEKRDLKPNYNHRHNHKKHKR